MNNYLKLLQESTSAYELVEISTGGKLSRHNVHIKQLGPETTTELSTLHLSVGNQTQDLHSSLVLDHPRAYSRQLHKCIVANPQGQAVFDGNVKVNRYFFVPVDWIVSAQVHHLSYHYTPCSSWSLHD